MAAEPSDGATGDAQSQKAPGRPARQQLLFELDMLKQAQEFNPQLQHDYFLSHPYAPSVKSLSELELTGIADLQLETHHRGKLLIVRTLDDGCRTAAVQTVVQDENGDADRLAFYNSDATLEPEEIIPEDAVFAIKEPFYTADAECGACLRIDHPSDFIRLDLNDKLVPSSIRDALITPGSSPSSKSALDWKADGNAAYKAGNYRAAVDAYTHAVLTCTSDDENVRRDVMRNRSIVNTYLRRFESAQADANAAIISDMNEDNSAVLNSKAYHRAGRAAYELHHFEAAKTYFQKVKELVPADKDATSELKRVELRLQEETSGDYDFATMSKSSSQKHNRLDHADFTRNTEVKQSQGRGRGLFATKDLSANELILCEKAFCVAFDSDREAKRTYNLLNRATKRRLAGSQSMLLFNATQKLLHNSDQAVQFFDLYDGNQEHRTPLQPVDGLVPVDTFRVNGIIENNSFACPSVRSSSKGAQKQSTDHASYSSTGLWVRASYVNHACNGNCMRSFIGDMIMLRASKDIAKGEEILMPYLVPDPKNSDLQDKMGKIFGFTCDCEVCVAEQNSSTDQQKERADLIDKLSTILNAHPLPLRQQADRRIVTQIERLFARLEATYHEKLFAKLPRIGLVAPGQWLSQAHLLNSGISRDKVLNTALATLRNNGFNVTITGQKVAIDRTHALVDGSAIEAAMQSARLYTKRGKAGASLGKQMEEFARSLYYVMSGEMKGFEESFGKI